MRGRERCLWMGEGLFLAHEYVDRSTVEIPFLPYLVLKIAAVWLLDPLRQVAEEYECRYRRAFEHGDILDFDELAFVCWGRVGRYDLEHICVEL